MTNDNPILSALQQLVEDDAVGGPGGTSQPLVEVRSPQE